MDVYSFIKSFVIERLDAEIGMEKAIYAVGPTDGAHITERFAVDAHGSRRK